MKQKFIAPPSGPGLSGDAIVPAFGSEDCLSRSKTQTVEVESERDEDGRYFAVNPFTGKRIYADKTRGQTISFTPILKP